MRVLYLESENMKAKERLWAGLPIYVTEAVDDDKIILVAEGVFRLDGTIDDGKIAILKNFSVSTKPRGDENAD